MKSRNILTLVLPPDIAVQLGELFDLKLEMLQGTKERVGDNVYKYTIPVPDEKSARIKHYILDTMTKSKNLSMN